MNELSGFPLSMKTEVLSLNRSTGSKLRFAGKRFKSFFNKIRPEFKYLLLALPIIATFFLVNEIRERQSLTSKAGIHSAGLSFQLQNWSLPPEHTFGVWINSDYPVGFADLTISFDQAKIKLTREVEPVGSLTNIIQKTSMIEANSTGRIRLVVGIKPDQRNSLPTQVFQIANITFDENTNKKNESTVVSFNPTSLQLVAGDLSIFNITSVQNLSLTINPLNRPISNPETSPTPSPEVRPTRTPRSR